MRIVGREDTRKLFLALLERPLVGRRRVSRRRPVLVLEDPRGGGKTSLMHSFETLLGGSGIPFVFVDAEAVERRSGVPAEGDRSSVPLANLIYAIAYQLSRDWGRPYRRIKFRRLTLARLVISMQIEGDQYDRDAARKRIDDLAQSRRPGVQTTRKLLADGAENATRGVLGALQLPEALRNPVADVARSVPDRLLSLLLRRTVGRWLLFGKYHSWFDGRGENPSDRAADVLLELRESSLLGDRRKWESWIDSMLISAMLADLAEHFAHRQRVAYGCALLIDNADGPVGRRLLKLLVEVRRPADEPADPLVVAVTSRGALRPEFKDEIRPLGEDGSGSWRSELARTPVPLVGLRKLSDLTKVDVGVLIGDLGIRGDEPSREVVRNLVHELTGGHPACTAKLVEVLGRNQELRGRPRELLREKVPAQDAGGGEVALSAWMLTHLTGEPDVPVRRTALETLTTCAAASSRSDTGELGPLIDSSHLNLVGRSLWPTDSSARSALTRTLLIERLARRDASAPDSWAEVFGRLTESARKLEDEAAESGGPTATLRRLGYQLANADARAPGGEVVGVEPAARFLVQSISAMSSRQWLDCLHTIGRAPHPSTDASPETEYQERRSRLLQDLGLTDAVTGTVEQRLIASVGSWLLGDWITSDPLSEFQRGRVYTQMKLRVQEVAGPWPHDDVWLFDEEMNDYATKAALWS